MVACLPACGWLEFWVVLAPFALDIVSKASWDITYRTEEKIKTIGRYRLVYVDLPHDDLLRQLRRRFDFAIVERDMEEVILSLLPDYLDKGKIEVYSPEFGKKYWAVEGA